MSSANKFTQKEIAYMRSLGLDCDFNNLSDDDDYWITIEETLGDHLTFHCADDDGRLSEEGWFCSSLFDKLPH